MQWLRAALWGHDAWVQILVSPHYPRDQNSCLTSLYLGLLLSNTEKNNNTGRGELLWDLSDRALGTGYLPEELVG